MRDKRCFDELVIDSHRAVELAPNSADVVNLASFGLTAGGRPEEAIRHSRKAMELNPNYPAVYLGNLGFAYRLAGCIEEAIATFKAYDARIPGKGFGLADLVICMNRTAGRTRLVRPQRVSWRPARTSRPQRGQEPRLSGKEGASTPTWPRYEPLGFLNSAGTTLRSVSQPPGVALQHFSPSLTAGGAQARVSRPNRASRRETLLRQPQSQGRHYDDERGRDAQKAKPRCWVGPRRARPMAFSSSRSTRGSPACARRSPRRASPSA